VKAVGKRGASPKRRRRGAERVDICGMRRIKLQGTSRSRKSRRRPGWRRPVRLPGSSDFNTDPYVLGVVWIAWSRLQARGVSPCRKVLWRYAWADDRDRMWYRRSSCSTVDATQSDLLQGGATDLSQIVSRKGMVTADRSSRELDGATGRELARIRGSAATASAAAGSGRITMVRLQLPEPKPARVAYLDGKSQHLIMNAHLHAVHDPRARSGVEARVELQSRTHREFSGQGTHGMQVPTSMRRPRRVIIARRDRRRRQAALEFRPRSSRRV